MVGYAVSAESHLETVDARLLSADFEIRIEVGKCAAHRPCWNGALGRAVAACVELELPGEDEVRDCGWHCLCENRCENRVVLGDMRFWNVCGEMPVARGVRAKVDVGLPVGFVEHQCEASVCADEAESNVRRGAIWPVEQLAIGVDSKSLRPVALDFDVCRRLLAGDEFRRLALEVGRQVKFKRGNRYVCQKKGDREDKNNNRDNNDNGRPKQPAPQSSRSLRCRIHS